MFSTCFAINKENSQLTAQIKDITYLINLLGREPDDAKILLNLLQRIRIVKVDLMFFSVPMSTDLSFIHFWTFGNIHAEK